MIRFFTFFTPDIHGQKSIGPVPVPGSAPLWRRDNTSWRHGSDAIRGKTIRAKARVGSKGSDPLGHQIGQVEKALSLDIYVYV